MEKQKLEFAYSWDWKEQPPFKSIIKDLQRAYKLNLYLHDYEIETGSDQEGVLLSTEKYTPEQAKEIWSNLVYQ